MHDEFCTGTFLHILIFKHGKFLADWVSRIRADCIWWLGHVVGGLQVVAKPEGGANPSLSYT
jgi:hypothetical protein